MVWSKLENPTAFDLAPRIDIKPIIDALIRFFTTWDERLTSLAKKLTKAFQLENDYSLLSKPENLGVLEGEEARKYMTRLTAKFWETLVRLLEEIMPEIDQFLLFTKNEAQNIYLQLKRVLAELERTSRPFRTENEEDYNNATNEFILFAQNLLDEVIYDSGIKQSVMNELSGQFLHDENKKNLETLRAYMLCLQNHSLGADIKTILEVLQFGQQLMNYRPLSVLDGKGSYHSKFLQLSSRIAF